MTLLIRQRQTSKSYNSRPQDPSVWHFFTSVCLCVCHILSSLFYLLASRLTQRSVEMNPAPLPGFCSLWDIKASHTLKLAGWLAGCAYLSNVAVWVQKERLRLSVYPRAGCFPDTSAFRRQPAGKYRGAAHAPAVSLHISCGRTRPRPRRRAERKRRKGKQGGLRRFLFDRFKQMAANETLFLAGQAAAHSKNQGRSGGNRGISNHINRCD